MLPAVFYQEGHYLDYTSGSAITAGDIIIVANRVHVATSSFAANEQAAIACQGVFRFRKDASVFAEGDPVFWNPTGNPVEGDAGSGAAGSASIGGYFAGYVIPGGGALTGATSVLVKLAPYGSAESGSSVPASTVAATGSTQSDAAQLGYGFTAVTAADATKGVKLPAAAPGRTVTIKNTVNAVLKVWPATGDGINAIAVNSSLSMAALTSATFTAIDATTWYTTPLVPS